MADPIDLANRSRRADVREEFDRRVDEQAAALREEIDAGRFENPDFGLGLELETYAVDGAYRLATLPDAVFDAVEGSTRELGLHNAEIHTSPDPFDGDGIESQAAALRRRYRELSRAAQREGLEVVLDAMWTVPPADGTGAYLTATRERDGLTIARNMTPDPRYWAIDNAILDRADGSITLSVPGLERSVPTILFESLTCSVQPHLQIPEPDWFPRYHAVAVRTLGPVLALATNSPLLPPDWYDVDEPRELLVETAHELRIPVFEETINQLWNKVRVPADVANAADVVDRLRTDPTCAPFLREWIESDERTTFDERFWEFDHKRGTYWRWVRPVLGGQPVAGGDQRSIRLEYRPLPAQPTIIDNIGFLCLVAGLVHGLVTTGHPLADLERDAAERCFYDVVEAGLDADLAWLTADRERTSDPATIYDEVFSVARRGLRDRGADAAIVDQYLGPLERRWNQSRTPSQWKLERVRDGLESGLSFEDAVREMQVAYARQGAEHESFAGWPAAI